MELQLAPGTLGSTEDVAPSILLTSHVRHGQKAAKPSQTRSLHRKLSPSYPLLWCCCLRLARTLSTQCSADKAEEAGTPLGAEQQAQMMTPEPAAMRCYSGCTAHRSSALGLKLLEAQW